MTKLRGTHWDTQCKQKQHSASARTFASFPTLPGLSSKLQLPAQVLITALQNWTKGAHWFMWQFTGIEVEAWLYFEKCWYWGNNDNRAKNSNRQEDFWGNFLGNLPQLSWNDAFCGQLGLIGSYWAQETATIESIERYLSLSATTNHITHFASPSPGFCFRTRCSNKPERLTNSPVWVCANYPQYSKYFYPSC